MSAYIYKTKIIFFNQGQPSGYSSNLFVRISYLFSLTNPNIFIKIKTYKHTSNMSSCPKSSQYVYFIRPSLFIWKDKAFILSNVTVIHRWFSCEMFISYSNGQQTTTGKNKVCFDSYTLLWWCNKWKQAKNSLYF